MCASKGMNKNIHRNIICNCAKLETTQLVISIGADKQMVTYAYKGRPHINKEEESVWNIDTFYKQNLEGIEARPEEYIYV